MNKQEDAVFSRFAHIIEQGDTGFFFGAGMSRNAGIPVANAIISGIVSSLEFPEDYAKKITELNYPFEAFLEMLSRYASLKQILDIFKLGGPTSFHLLVKDLVEKGLVKQLMTTNFDLLIEKTRVEGLNVLYDEKDFHRLSSKTVNYIKVHGGVNKPDTIRTVMGSITRKQLRARRKDAIDFFFKEAGLKTVFVFGYSCSDKLDLTPYIKSVTGGNTRIVFISHSQSGVTTVSRMDDDNPFSVFENTYVECNTDSLIRYLINYFHVSDSLTPNHFSIKEYLDYSKLGVYERNLFGGGLLFRNAYLQDAVNLLRNALNYEGDRIQRVGIISLLFEIYHNIQATTSKPMDEVLPPGVTYTTMEGDKNESLSLLGTITDDTIRLNKTAELKIHWGHVLLSYRKYDEAMIAYRDAMELFKQTANTYRIYQCQNNIANTIFTRWNNGDSSLTRDEVYRECYQIWRKCLVYFRQSEYPFEYEISCENMADLLLNLRKNHIKRIFNYLNTAKELSRYLNDRTGIENCDEMIKEVMTSKRLLSKID